MPQENILALLRIGDAEGHEQVVELRESTINLGRLPPCEVLLSNAQVSRQHARVLFEADRISLVDLRSSNGTFVGTTKLSPNVPYALSYRETFRIGPFTLRLEPAPQPLPEMKAQDQPPASGEQPLDQILIGVEDRPSPPEPPSEAPPAENDDVPYADAFGLPGDFSRYMEYLPPIYREHNLLGRFLLAFEGVLVPIEQTVDHFDLYLDPVMTPAHFLDRLASWLGLTLDEKWSLEKRRTLVAEAVELYRRRGTRWSLSRHLEIYTGLAPDILEPAERPHHFQVVVHVAEGRRLDRDTIERIIRANQPAHTTYSLEIVPKA